MRIWSILFIKSDLKWCKHLSRSLYLYSDIDKYITLLCEKDKNCNIEKSEEVSDIKIPKMPRWCMQLVALLLSVYSASWKVHPGEFFLAYMSHIHVPYHGAIYIRVLIFFQALKKGLGCPIACCPW